MNQRRQWQVHCPNATSGVWLFPWHRCLQRVVQMGCHLRNLSIVAINNALGKVDVPIKRTDSIKQLDLLTVRGFQLCDRH